MRKVVHETKERPVNSGHYDFINGYRYSVVCGVADDVADLRLYD